ncbi:MAG TPA: Uma2 family endonuclease, partial [Chloroflexota bacterium]|nr:Uma2 family endonuclease [Chloroflexota bacterium]
MRAEVATLDWPDEDLFDSEEQDEPLAGQDHRDTIDSLSYPLRGRLAGPDCYVAAELRVHRNPANLRDYREPDILVALGVVDRVRPRYDLWVEHKAPDLVIEVLSLSSVENKDLTAKKDWYRKEGVQEYVVLDPSGDFAPEPRLQAWRLGARPDGSADVHRTSTGEQPLWSEVIAFGWRVVEGRVRVVDRVSGEIFPWITDVEPQLRREVELRRAAQREAQEAQEQARLAQEQARLAAEWAVQAEERERQARAELATEAAHHAVEQARLEREHAEALAQLRRRL